jgi:hypothetical protein
MSPSGWWIQIVGTTNATQIGIQTGPSKHDNEVWGSWKSGDAMEVPIRDKDQTYNVLFVQLNNPQEKQINANVLYGNKLLQEFSFDGKMENHTIDRR